MKTKKTLYITTTIPYANAPPHIGFALEIVQADVLARWNRLKGKDVFFLTGTDEHGVKNYQTAKKEGLDTQKFVDKNSAQFKKLTKALDISNDGFIRTTDKKVHWPGVFEIWKRLERAGDIYKKEYSGSYCYGCERFITEKELIGGKCPDHSNLKIQHISEINYFFKLSKYSDKIKNLIKTDKLKITPLQWKNNFLALIKDGLTDVSFSREKKHLPWGIPVPGNEDQRMYVWPDALSNYLTGIGFPNKKYKKYWPADIHLVGKDMLRFHTGIWPGMLLSAGFELPKEVIVHGFLTVGGRKMSKSLGNVVAPLELIKRYSSDSIRYVLTRSIPFGEDGDFSEEKLIERHNNELANKLGNLVSRTTNLIEKYGCEKFDYTIPDEKRWERDIIDGKVEVEKILNINPKEDFHVFKKSAKLSEEGLLFDSYFRLRPTLKLICLLTDTQIKNYQFDKALNTIFAFIDNCNKFIQEKKIWETKDRKALFELKESIIKVAELLSPFIPESAEKIKKQFSAKKIKKSEILFKKIS